MNEIGGYFGLELKQGENVFHTSPYKMKSGRSSLSFILTNCKLKHVYLPFYTCDALLEPFDLHNISYSFYAINKKFELDIMPVLKDGEMLVYINYYGIKDEYVEQLSNKYTDKLTVDCTQAYFTKGNGRSWYFNSTRKFFGVPDGSDLYVPNGFDWEDIYDALPVSDNYITDHLFARFNDEIQKGYPYFQKNETLNGGGAAKMSVLTQCLLSNIDFEKVMEVRKQNFSYLDANLQDSNQLSISTCSPSVPFFYPYLPAHTIDKKKLWAENIFIPVLWNDCLQRANSIQFPIERELSEELLPIPVDHRYAGLQMDRMLDKIKPN